MLDDNYYQLIGAKEMVMRAWRELEEEKGDALEVEEMAEIAAAIVDLVANGDIQKMDFNFN